jgi:hypothetical protein
MLKENKEKKDIGGVIVLITDGKNSPGYLDISDVKKDIIEAAIRVITIAFGYEQNRLFYNKSPAFY